MSRKKKGVIYTRVSSNPQEETGYSLPAQEDLGRDAALSENVEIVQLFSESHSAKEAGRKEFNNMLRFLKKNKDIQHVFVESTNRLLRNEFDSAVIIQLATTTDINFHIIKDRMVLNKQSTPMELFMFTMNTAVSSIYPRNLSLDVKKGMDKKAALGFFPGRAPVGYKNLREAKKKSSIIIDTEKAPFVKRAFELYATGCFAYKTLADKLASEGFYPYKNPCSKSNIEDILNNPFYIGEFEYKGKRYYEGQHDPLVSKETFYAVQKIIKAQGSPRKVKHDFLYQGLIKCAVDGCSVVGELHHGANKSGHYEYYRCTGNKGVECGKKYLKSGVIDKAIEGLFKSLQFSQEFIDIVLMKLKDVIDKNFEYEQKSLDAIQQKISILKSRLNHLYTDKLDGIIDESFYLEKKEEWQSELLKLNVEHAAFTTGDESIIQKATLILELCKNAYSLYSQQDNEEKRVLLKLLCSNFTWDGQNLRITLKSTVKTLLSGANLFNGGGKAATLELFVNNLYKEIANSDNVIFFEQVKKYLAA